jgi:CRP-like cAMP-binding protein
MAHDTVGARAGPFPLLTRGDGGAQREAATSPESVRGRYWYLLDLDADLALGLDRRMRLVARQAVTARVCDVPAGPLDLDPLLASLRGGLGLLIVDGVIVLDVHVGDRTASELVGDGDLLAPAAEDDALLTHETFARVLVRSRVALLDEAFAERVRAWPQIVQALLHRAARRTMDLNVHRAATCHPRAEVRIALLLWHLAARWGRVEPDGIQIPLPLTHRLIGQLIGAERPSVSHALARLASAGLVTRSEAGLVLHGSVDHHISCLVEHHIGDA